jgi:hypothetical protein
VTGASLQLCSLRHNLTFVNTNWKKGRSAPAAAPGG